MSAAPTTPSAAAAHDDKKHAETTMTSGGGGGPLPSTRAVVEGVFGAVKDYGKLAGQLPAEDYDYHQAFPAFRALVREHGESLVRLMRACTQLLPPRRRVRVAPERAAVSGAVVLPEAQRAGVMEAIDSLLENVDTVLDELRGRRLHGAAQLGVTFGAPLVAAAVHDSTGAHGSGGGGVAGAMSTVMHEAHGAGGGEVRVAAVMRPQLSFATPVDNSDTPFVPVYYDEAGRRHVGQAGVHPFADRIRAFRVPDAQLRVGVTETPPLPLSQCPLHFVDTEDALRRLVAALLPPPAPQQGDEQQQHQRPVRELAVDLEHHSFHSYQGFTCLMQLSTREADYIVDCLRLRSSMHLLAPLFLCPDVVKVLHGAREDVRWLQKDFGLYLVNFFDTSVALQALHMPHSLAFAVDHFCQVRLDKRYQTADWRVRPLPAEMVNYARYDTHFLLYIYDRLRALLLNSEGGGGGGPLGNLLLHVYKESQRLSLQLYEKATLQPEATYKVALGRSLGGLTPAQERVARELFNWRDAAARRVDDSPSAVMHLSSVLAVASKMPRTASELLRCCHPVSAVVRAHLVELVALVRRAARGSRNDDDGVDGDDKDDEEQEEQEQQRVGQSDTTTMAGAASARVHATRIHRAMTGTLPSIESCIGPALTCTLTSAQQQPPQQRRRRGRRDGGGGGGADDNDNDDDAAAMQLTCTRPSQWLCSMRALAQTLSQRPLHVVPLPGSKLLLATTQQQQQRDKATRADKTSQQQVPRAQSTSSSSSSSSSEADDDKDTKEDEQSEDKARTKATGGAEAVAIRQVYGLPPRKRRRAH